jgi:ferritin-like metal-binding protein YciE
MKQGKTESRGGSRGRQTSESRQGVGSTKQQQPMNETDTDESMKNHPLHQLFLNELADVYSAEQQLIKALPRMAEAAQSEELRSAIESHLEETKNQAERLDQVAKGLNETLEDNTCEAMEGLLKEGKELMEEYEGNLALDPALIAAAQKVEHYEIATYGTLIAWARQMGHQNAVLLLEETLEEEKNADEKLTSIAEEVNVEADKDV